MRLHSRGPEGPEVRSAPLLPFLPLVRAGLLPLSRRVRRCLLSALAGLAFRAGLPLPLLLVVQADPDLLGALRPLRPGRTRVADRSLGSLRAWNPLVPFCALRTRRPLLTFGSLRTYRT